MQPEEVSYAYEELSKIGGCFWKCAWSLQTRKCKLTQNLKNSNYVQKKFNTGHNPVDFVFSWWIRIYS
jgi:fructose-bisphosphate aldolase class II